ncbi:MULTISPECIES: ABC transporter ATP-binding protein [unclassified Commensalibacter]|uniref:ABC transporter ATP-binding protein n=1 Tax=unclassified Commensalibacter TaxID=2630218 RepID=UPI0018DCF66B|nr:MULTISPECIES: ABC transporter ATP-binding protein [unclassified Commensalibacter]MBH9969920.1 ABC transporter ATP-binding protein [Commensalibacter sp. M0265]MBH9977184.1 ABC transporter ATP-binding protein [Commensalibacter sp. M0266]MBH9992955.1 ABC transporter ATP-binding protein [Commensalibacter sp. M0270]MBI0046360.1 ABC transporter ATP-binding protein [Commensalibacter sp. M0267]MBI0056120.1 ABC transporter ATP-binding protein [Commensalibacter sp. M0268]
MPSITVKNLYISFPLYHENMRNLRKITNIFLSGRLSEDKHRKIYVQSLRDISFSIKGGERVGLIGTNGAGKTTLLRTMSGIYEPVSGHLRIEGHISSLLDPSVGMNPELTGRENIRLRCYIDGVPRKQMNEIEEKVIEFSELGSYIDLPVKTYSSGMNLRLGFGLITAIDPQILLMDEWFMTGDEGFMLKATHRLENIVKKSQILIISTHSPQILIKWCNRIIWLEQGFLKMDGTPQEVLPVYLNKPVDELFR